MRELIFISHANPEDNEFTRWLSMRLAQCGYSVWSDVTKLIGGETWWNDIEKAIREQTVKLLYVLSRHSNAKQGPRSELHLALSVEKNEKLKDFILPILIDASLPYSEINIELSSRNAIDFVASWADGLSSVLEKLTKEEVPKDLKRFSPSIVTTWWQTHVEGKDILQSRGSEQLSNWLPITQMPEVLQLMDLGRAKYIHNPDGFPAHRIARYVLSFAQPSDLGITVRDVQQVRTADVLAGIANSHWLTSQEIVNALVRMLRLGVNRELDRIGLPRYEMSSDRICHYFTTSVLSGKKSAAFENADDVTVRRSLLGSYRGHVWHFGLSFELVRLPQPIISTYMHVLFSDDGATIWKSKGRLHAARRSACKDWWNDRWRDAMLVALDWLARQQNSIKGYLQIPLSSDLSLSIAGRPMSFHSPYSYASESLSLPTVDEQDFDTFETNDAEGEPETPND